LATAAVGLVLVVGGFAWAVTDLPAFGHYHHRYGAYLAQHSLPQRGATNSINVITFDYRGFDTLGEEFILFVAVVGVVVLLRRLRGEEDESDEDINESQPLASESLRWLGVASAAPLAVIGAYVVTHGQLTPGGGFQGGVILMAAVTIVFVGGEFMIMLRLRARAQFLEMGEALGAAGLAVLGFGGLIASGVFFENFIPHGHRGSLFSGGFLTIANLAVGIEVAGAILMVLAELLDQRLLTRPA
jgi:multicomponent Na+:H+ antiporter subunit B